MVSDSEKRLEYVKRPREAAETRGGNKHAYSVSSAGFLTRACAIMFSMLRQVAPVSLLDTGLSSLAFVRADDAVTDCTFHSEVLMHGSSCKCFSRSHRMWDGQYLPKFEIFSLIEELCIDPQRSAVEIELFILFGPKKQKKGNVNHVATRCSL